MKVAYIVFILFLNLSLADPVFSASVKNIPVPFTVQTPDADWRQPWQDACEETVIAMVGRFYSDLGEFDNAATAKTAILDILKKREELIGPSLDENAATIAKIVNNRLNWTAVVVENPTLAQMKSEIDNDRPIILPVHGKYLYNPHFKNGGPDYHSIVISGYDEANQQFIVQEPGTRHGLDFRYSYATIENAMHDFLPNLRTKFGKKVAIFTRPKIKLTGNLIKAPNGPEVYLLNNGVKQHIANENSFLRHGWNWHNIFPVPYTFIKSLPDGETID